MPKVSVIMPVYNAKKYLNKAIDSILNQTYTDFEFIIIDDASSDGSQEIVKSYSDPRIRFYINEKNMGVAATLNRGIEIARGEYIARMDSDDISLPNRLQEQVDFLDVRHDVGVVGANVEIFGEGIPTKIHRFPTESKHLKAMLLFSSCFAHPVVMMRKSCLKENQLKYLSDFDGIEDYALWWELGQVCKLGSIDKVLLKYRQHCAQVTKNHSEYHVQRRINFVEKRLGMFQCEISDREKRLIYLYSCGHTTMMSAEKVKEFIELVQKLKASNRNRSFFAPGYLAKILSSATMDVIATANLKNKERKKMYILAMRSGAIPRFTGLRIIFQSIWLSQ